MTNVPIPLCSHWRWFSIGVLNTGVVQRKSHLASSVTHIYTAMAHLQTKIIVPIGAMECIPGWCQEELGPWDARKIAAITGKITIPHMFGWHFRLDIELARVVYPRGCHSGLVFGLIRRRCGWTAPPYPLHRRSGSDSGSILQSVFWMAETSGEIGVSSSSGISRMCSAGTWYSSSRSSSYNRYQGAPSGPSSTPTPQWVDR